MVNKMIKKEKKPITRNWMKRRKREKYCSRHIHIHIYDKENVSKILEFVFLSGIDNLSKFRQVSFLLLFIKRTVLSELC